MLILVRVTLSQKPSLLYLSRSEVLWHPYQKQRKQLCVFYTTGTNALAYFDQPSATKEKNSASLARVYSGTPSSVTKTEHFITLTPAHSWLPFHRFPWRRLSLPWVGCIFPSPSFLKSLQLLAVKNTSSLQFTKRCISTLAVTIKLLRV